LLVMFPLLFPLPYLREVLEFVPSVSNVLIILFTSMSSWREVDKIMRPFLTLAAHSSTSRRHVSGQNNEYITNTRGKLEHSTKTWKLLELAPIVSNVPIILSTSISSWSARV
jgi:hypothetical protein